MSTETIITALPEVSEDAATIIGWSDRYAATIVSRSARSVVLRRDQATLLNGPDSGEPDALRVHPGGFAAVYEGAQRWRYEPDPTALQEEFTLRKSGRWVAKGQPDRPDSRRAILGRRAHHYDFNF